MVLSSRSDAAAARRDAAKRLDEFTRSIRACRICVETPRGKGLPHEPRPVLRASATARIAVVGQAPGTRVHASGKPFTDPSGDRLRDWMGVTSEEFYDDRRIAIVPMGFCFPGLDAAGGDLPPRKECAPAWRARLFALMPQLQLVLLVGAFAQKWHWPASRKQSVSETVAAYGELLAGDGHRRYFPLPHPSWRNTSWIRTHPLFETDVLPRLKREVRALL